MPEYFTTLGTWIEAAFTLILLSVLFKDNPVYRFAEATMVGLYAAQGVLANWFDYVKPQTMTRLFTNHEWHLLIPIVFGLLAYTRYIKGYSWLAKYNICFVMGVSSGLVIFADFKPLFIDQIRAAMVPLWTGDWWVSLSNCIMLFGTAATILYFVFTLKKQGVPKHISTFARVVMMIAFGSHIGSTVTGRVTLFFGRMQFLLGTWLKLLK